MAKGKKKTKTGKRPLTDTELDAVNEMVWSGWSRRDAEREVRETADFEMEVTRG